MDQYPALKYAPGVQFQLQPAVVTLALTPSSISENGGMSTVTATLAHPLSAATTITVRPVAGAYTVPVGFDDHHCSRAAPRTRRTRWSSQR